MRCTRCDTENDSARKFCKECAAPLAASCPNCGAANEPDAKFCGECATPLTGLAPATAAGGTAGSSPVGTRAPSATAPIHEAERRLVTVLFADLVGFTPFAEERDAEDVRDTLTRYFDVARETIERYGGTVEKFIGDAVMAVWGAPTAQEDDAERAVRAGLDLVGAVRVLGPEIMARVGILTGEVAVTIGATNQGMVAGDIVNTAARLQSIAEPGTVIVGESTRNAADAAIAFEPVGEATLKGKSSPVPAFRALRVVAERGGRNRQGGLEAPFVGRDEELRTLKDAFGAVQRERKPRLVSVVGPAGIGKSRLAWEFEKYLDGVVDPVWWQLGRSPSYGDGITFWALGEMVRARANLAENDEEGTTRARVAEMLARHSPDEAERRWLEPAILTLLGIGGDNGASQQLFAAWRTFFERLAASGTVVMVFEDLQWADPGTVEFIDHLLEWSRDQRILIVTLARPELIDRVPTWGAGKRQFVSVYLEPLPEAAMRELLDGLVPGLPDRAARTIVARAGGMPLYAVEMVRMLVSEGRLVETDGRYAPTGDLTELSVPDSLTALIGSRLDALEPADRALAQDASVLGQTFSVEALAAVAGMQSADLDSRLGTLVHRELLVLRADPRTPDHGQYAFVQALVREVAYNTLARKDRKTRHLAAARYFESLSTDELAGALAGQYIAAYENAAEGAEADALASQARIALKAAADRAVALGSPDQATSFLRQALSVTRDPSEEAELSMEAGIAASNAGRHEPAVDYLRRAVTLLESLDDRAMLARATGELGHVLTNGREMEDAVAALEHAAAAFADLPADIGTVRINTELARAYLLTSRMEAAADVGDRAATLAERANLPALIADALVTKGSALAALGRSAEGLILIRGAGDLAESVEAWPTVLRARTNASASLALEDPRANLEYSLAGLALARRLGYRGMEQVLLQNAAWSARMIGDWDFIRREAEYALGLDLDDTDRLQVLVNVIALRIESGDEDPALEAEFEALVSPVADSEAQPFRLDLEQTRHMAAGRFADAARTTRALAETSPLNAADALTVACRASLLAHDLEQASADLAALRALGTHGRAFDISRAGLEAGVAALEGRAVDALAGHREVLRGLHELGVDFEIALVGLQCAALMDPSIPEMAAAIDEARAIFTRIGAAPFLVLLDRALAKNAATPAAGSANRSPGSRPTVLETGRTPAG